MKITPETLRLLEREARIRAKLTSYKELAAKTGLSSGYISNFIGRLVRKECLKVDIEHNGLKSGRRYTDAEIKQFAAELMRK